MIRNLTYLVCILLFSKVINAQNIKVISSSPKIKIGQHDTITFTVKSDTKNEIAWFEWGDTLTSSIEILEHLKIDTSYSDDLSQRELSQKIIITSFDSGYYAIPPQKILVNGEPVDSDPIMLAVFSVNIEQGKELNDIKAPIQTPLTWKDYYQMYGKFVLLAVLLLALIIGLIIWLRKRAKNRIPTVIEPKKPIIPAYVTATQQLEQLKKEGLWQKGKTKLYYSKLTEIIFLYIEKQLHIPAIEQTTRELTLSIESKPFAVEAKTKLGYLLNSADLVKFAKSTPIANENEMSMQYAFDFVNITKPEPESEESNTQKTELDD